MSEYSLPEQVRDAERAVLGSCLLSADAIDDCAALVKPGDFWQPRHERIYAAVLGLVEGGHPADVITVADRLGEDLARLGGAAYLHELVASVSTAANAGYHAEIVRRSSLHRAVVTTGQRLAAMPASEDDVLDVVNAARAELDALIVDDGGTSHSQDVYAALEALEGDNPFVPTPWKDLTDAIGGFRPGCLYYVGARPGVGKSIVGGAIALDVARRGQHAHIATLEMSKVELYHRMLASVGGVDQGRMQNRWLHEHEWAKLAKAAAHIEALPLSVDDRGTQTVADIRAKARAIARTSRLGIVVVDYLQLMRSSGRAESRQQEVSEFSRSLKLLAKELQVPVIALSQLNRGSEHRQDRMPGMADLRESGALEQDGDAVLLLHRDVDERPDELLISVAKHRHGPADLLVRLQWEGRYARATDRLSTQPNRTTTTEGSPSYLKD